jgi:hypothetical protein
MSTSPVPPEDIRAAAETYEELGPEYHDAVVAAFVDKVEREVAARVEARLADERRALAAGGRRGMAGRRPRVGMLVKSIAVGAAGGALVAFLGFNHTEPAQSGSAHPSHVGTAPGPAHLLPFFPSRISLARPPAPRASTQP